MKERSERRWFWFACCLFLVCTFVFLYPYSFDPAHTVSDAGDPLLNISTLWRVQQHLAKGEILDLYEADYFYPRKSVLAYSEIMLPTAIIAWPVAAISDNPVLAYNFVFLLNYFLTALFTFLLVRRLTGSPVAGIVSGLLFAFCQWRLHRPAHIQLLTNQWVPLTMLFLHKFWDTRRLRHVVIAAVLFAIQTMSCIYLGLIFSIGVAIFLGFIAISHYWEDANRQQVPVESDAPTTRRSLRRTIIGPAVTFALVSGGMLALPLLPYFRLSPTLEKGRWGADGADLLSYILSSQILFVGLPAMIIIPLGLALWRRYYARQLTAFRSTGEPSWLLKMLLVINRICLAVIVLVMILRLLNVNVKGINLGLIPLAWPLYVALATGAAVIVFRKLALGRFMPRLDDQQALYVVIAIAGIVLSLGPKMWVHGYSYGTGPYVLLAKLLPPFAGMREIGRFGVMALFGLYVLAGFATTWTEYLIALKFGKKARCAFAAAALVGIAFSIYPTVPAWSYRVPDRSEMPSEYKWLASQPGDALIVEVPILPREGSECEYLYFGLFHRKKLINGYRGWSSPDYQVVCRALAGYLPSRWSAVILDEIGVDYILFHLDKIPKKLLPFIIENTDRGGLEHFRLLRRFGDCFIFHTKRAALGLPRGPLLSCRKLVFRASFGDQSRVATELSGDCKDVVIRQALRGESSEIVVTLEEPALICGVLADFGKPVSNPYSCPFELLIKGPDGYFDAVPLTPEVSLFEYRKALYGPSFCQVMEFSVQEVETETIRIRLATDERDRRAPQVNVWGYKWRSE